MQQNIIRAQFSYDLEQLNQLEICLQTYIEQMERLGYKVLYKATIQASNLEAMTVVFMEHN